MGVIRSPVRVCTRRIAGSVTGAKLVVVYDYYIDATNGNDSNDGSRGSPWKSLNKITGSLIQAGQTTRCLVKSDTYSAASDYIYMFSDTATGNIEVVFEEGCVMDGTAAQVATPNTNGIHLTGSNGVQATIRGNGLIIQNYAEGTALSPNGVATGGTAIMTVNDVHVDNCDDGFSAHESSQMYLNDCSATNAEKSPFLHVQSAVVVANRCVFNQGSNGGGLQFVDGTSTDVTLNDCVITPTTNGEQLGADGVTFNRCIVGSESMRVQPVASSGVGATLNDCFINVYVDGNSTVALTRCYGRFTNRIRNGGGLTMENCVITGPATGHAQVLHQGYDPGSGSPVVCNNNIFEGVYTFDNLQAGVTADYVMDAVGTAFYNNIMYGPDYSANLVAADNGGQIAGTLYSDPLLGSLLGTDQEDYGWLSGSPAEGAAYGGGDIGFSAASV